MIVFVSELIHIKQIFYTNVHYNFKNKEHNIILTVKRILMKTNNDNWSVLDVYSVRSDTDYDCL